MMVGMWFIIYYNRINIVTTVCYDMMMNTNTSKALA